MLPALGVGEVGAVILVHGEAEATLEGTDVVFEEVRIFLEVDGFERELAKSFTAVGVRAGIGGNAAAAEFTARTVLGRRLAGFLGILIRQHT